MSESSGPWFTLIGILIGVLGTIIVGVVGAWVTGSYNLKAQVIVEEKRAAGILQQQERQLESDLIIKAIDTEDQETAA